MNYLYLLQVQILQIILYTAKKEQSGLARCIALSGLGIYLIQEFERRSKHTYIKEAFNTLLLALKVKYFVCLFVHLILMFKGKKGNIHFIPEEVRKN